MADTQTANYSFTLVQIGASRDTWGGKYNANWSAADVAIKAISDRVAGTAPAATGGGVVARFAAAGMTGGRIFLSAASDSDPTSQPGDIWLGF